MLPQVFRFLGGKKREEKLGQFRIMAQFCPVQEAATGAKWNPNVPSPLPNDHLPYVLNGFSCLGGFFCLVWLE